MKKGTVQLNFNKRQKNTVRVLHLVAVNRGELSAVEHNHILCVFMLSDKQHQYGISVLSWLLDTLMKALKYQSKELNFTQQTFYKWR